MTKPTTPLPGQLSFAMRKAAAYNALDHVKMAWPPFIDMRHLHTVTDFISAQAERIVELESERDYQISQRWADQEAREKAEARVKVLEEALLDNLANLTAATSLLKRGGYKKAAPSGRMFDQMIRDYENSAERSRKIFDKEAALAAVEGK
jgi:hypothetical protein